MPDCITQAIPRHTHGASRKKYSDLLKTYYKPSAEHDLPVQDDDQAPGARIASNPRNTLPGAPKLSTAPEASQLSIETDLFMNSIPDELPSNVASMRDPEGVSSSQSDVGRTSAAQSQHLTRRLIRRGAEGQKKPQPKSFSEDLDGRSYEKYQSELVSPRPFGTRSLLHSLLDVLTGVSRQVRNREDAPWITSSQEIQHGRVCWYWNALGLPYSFLSLPIQDDNFSRQALEGLFTKIERLLSSGSFG